MQTAPRVKVLKVLESIHVQRVGICKLDLCKSLNPLVFKGLFCRDTILGVESQHFGNEIFRTL